MTTEWVERLSKGPPEMGQNLLQKNRREGKSQWKSDEDPLGKEMDTVSDTGTIGSGTNSSTKRLFSKGKESRKVNGRRRSRCSARHRLECGEKRRLE